MTVPVDASTPPGARRPPPLRALAMGVLAAILLGLAIVASAGRPGALDLVVVPHPDDEMQAWGLLQEVSASHTVFAFLTRGEETGTCREGLPALDEASGEAVPDPRPDGRWTPACAQARVNATMAFLAAMGDDDPRVPSSWGTARRVPLAVDGARRCDGGSCGPVADPLVFAGDGPATAIFLDLGDGDLTTSEVTGAITAIVAAHDDLGVPDLAWRHLVAASYANEVQPGCVSYPHPDHLATQAAVVDLGDDVFQDRWVATCADGPDPVERVLVDEDVWNATFEVTPDGTRRGPHPVLYGWLLDPYWPNDPEIGSQEELFHRDQAYLHLE